MNREFSPIEAANDLFCAGLVKNNDPDTLKYMCDWDYNCWGFTAWAFGWIKNLTYIDGWDMEEYLEKWSRPVNKPAPGCIAVFRGNDGELLHTAIVYQVEDPQNPVVVEKNGSFPLRVETVKETINWARGLYGRVTEYRRAF